MEHTEGTEPSLSDIMAAICDLKGIIDPKLDVVTIDVNLLRADFKKISGKVTKAAVRLYGNLAYKNSTVRFFLDLTLQVQQQRQSFEKVKKTITCQRPQVHDVRSKATG
ncbi:hypothetical protein NDU88_002077 [Pleurodeles waltl]|uniref:Uncharacterized protein n=1 Tax=Pleurodeles waltl TaxID=8319 RepID=A0AAV7Q7P2_PLEWA|nr:hypothetical protein NDU88_002077 [Pleurodeles waltl]